MAAVDRLEVEEEAQELQKHALDDLQAEVAAQSAQKHDSQAKRRVLQSDCSEKSK